MARPSLPDVLLDRIRSAYEGGEIVRRIAAEAADALDRARATISR